jgi:NADH-quinone oxidoreductase subunit C
VAEPTTGAGDSAATDPGADDVPGTDAPEAPPEPETRLGALVTYSRGQQVLHPDRDQLVDLVRTLRDDEGFRMCVDVTAVDYVAYGAHRDLPEGVAGERFEVVVGLLSHSRRERVRVRVQVPADDPTCPSLFDVHPGTEALEREVYDMFGITFTDHPDMTRILMPEDWDGHPLRKDNPVGAIPVQFKGIQNAR